MRIAPLYGLLVIAILVTALVGVFDGDDTSTPSVEANQVPELGPASTSSVTTQPTTTITSPPPSDRAPDVDALGAPVVDLLGTTTTAPQATASARAPSQAPAPTTTPRSVSTSTVTAPPVTVQAGPNAEFEGQFASKINSLRSGGGLPTLERDGSLDAQASGWAERMAGNGGLNHSNLSSLLPPWSAAAENVGRGGSVDDLFSSLVGSSGHKANMLGDYTHMGVGVWVDSAGTVWTAHLFTR